MPARYLLNFSFIGTGFRGSSKSIKNVVCEKSVQGTIETGLLRLAPKVYPSLSLSSRTDAGVHALECTAHVDLETVNGNIYAENRISQILNRYFVKNEKAICIRNVRQVNPTFHARFFVKSRTYLYRLAVLKKGIDENVDRIELPIEEKNRFFFIKKSNFDVQKVREALKLFEGEHDFGTFKKVRKGPWKSCRRIIYSADLYEGRPMVTTFTLENYNQLEYWDFKFRANGYLYNQIRRIIGTLVAVGFGDLDISEVVTMLQIPDKNSWPSNVGVAPPSGLYLCSIEYDEKDLICN